MAGNNSENIEKRSKKWSNPFKRMLDGAKKMVKKEENGNEVPSSSDSPKKGKDKKGKEPENPKLQKVEAPETKENEKEKKTKKAKNKEQKLPKKYRKGW